MQEDLVIVSERKLNWLQLVVGALAGEKKRAGQKKE